MKRFWTRGDGLEHELRMQRPEPRKEFLRELETTVSGDRYRPQARSLRLGMAGALTVAMVISVASFGGIGYAATGVTHAVKAASHVVAPARKAAPAKKAQPLSSARVQYYVSMCYKKHTIQVDSHATGTLSGLGATQGACGGAQTPPLTNTVFVCIKGHNVRVTPATRNALVKAKTAKAGFCKV
jgi:hypothetical protein